MKKSQLTVLLLAIVSSSLCFAADRLKYDASTYDFNKGCFDPTSKTFSRTQLSTAADIQTRIDSKDFECTEISDVLVEGDNTQPLYASNGPGGVKIVFLKGSAGPLGTAGATGFNFNGAKITNLFLDYNMRMKGTANGMNANGVYLAFYADFNPDTCSRPDNMGSAVLPPYASASKDGATAMINLYNKRLADSDARIFDLPSMQCH